MPFLSRNVWGGAEYAKAFLIALAENKASNAILGISMLVSCSHKSDRAVIMVHSADSVPHILRNFDHFR